MEIMKRILLSVLFLTFLVLPTSSQVNYQQEINKRCQALLDSAWYCRSYTEEALIPIMHNLIPTMQTEQPLIDSLLVAADAYEIQRYGTAQILDSLSTLIVRKGELYSDISVLRIAEDKSHLIENAAKAVGKEAELRETLVGLFPNSLEFARKHNLPVSSEFEANQYGKYTKKQKQALTIRYAYHLLNPQSNMESPQYCLRHEDYLGHYNAILALQNRPRLSNVTLRTEETGNILSYITAPELASLDSLTILGSLDESDINVISRSCLNLKYLNLYDCQTISNDRTFNSDNQEIFIMTVPKFHTMESLESIILPRGALVIEKSALANFPLLENVTFPENLLVIDDNAFEDCVSLEEIHLISCFKLGSHAFSGCTSLVNVELPEQMQQIGDYAFVNCQELTSIRLSEGLSEIPYGCFHNCKSLRGILVPSTVTKIGPENHSEKVSPTQYIFTGTTPPENSGFQFKQGDSLIVPQGCTTAYYNAYNLNPGISVEEFGY